MSKKRNFKMIYFELMWRGILIFYVIFLFVSLVIMSDTLLVLFPVAFFSLGIVFILVYKEKVYNTIVEVCVDDNLVSFKTLRDRSICYNMKDIVKLEPLFIGNGTVLILQSGKKLYLNQDLVEATIVKDGIHYCSSDIEKLFSIK